jgi:hypothetical protein
MSEAVEATFDTQSKPNGILHGSADQHAFAQVDKWMAMIREIDRERPEPAKVSS